LKPLRYFLGLLICIAGAAVILEYLFYRPLGGSLYQPTLRYHSEYLVTAMPFLSIIAIGLLSGAHSNVRVAFWRYVMPLALVYGGVTYIVWAENVKFGQLDWFMNMPSGFWYALIDKIEVGALLGASVILHIYAVSNLSFTKEENRYGYAKFAKRTDIKKMGLSFNGKGTVLGKLGERLVTTDKPLSVLCLAPPGTGKTSGFVVPNLLRNENSMVIYDKKGELYKLTANARQKLGQTTLVWDIHSKNTARFNVLSKEFLPDDEAAYLPYIENIAHLLIAEDGESGDKFFIQAARDVFKFFALYGVLSEDDMSIAQVSDLIFEGGVPEKNLQLILAIEELPSLVQKLGNKVLSDTKASDQWAGIIGTLRNALSVFDDPQVRLATEGQSNFSGMEMRALPTSVYVRIKETDSDRLKPVVRLLFNTLANQLISTMPSRDDRAITFICDEFKRMGKLEQMMNLPEISRGYKLNLLIVAQDYGQIESMYGRSAISVLETNTEYKVILRQNNHDTAKRISEFVGSYTDKRSSESVDKKGMLDKTVSENVADEGISLISAQDIMSLSKEECFIIAGGAASKPIKAKLAFLMSQKEYERKLTA
jgi:type IV secretion system protein VirD4